MDNELIKSCEAKAQEWLASSVYDNETKDEIRAMLESDDKTALVDAFYQTLEFGTGGLRGIMGAGTNRMNRYIVGAATQGFANYILKAFSGRKDLSVVVGHDCRNHGREYAETVANIFSANGIKVYLFESLRPTPRSPSPYVSSRLKLVSTSPPRTIPRSTTATRPTGKTAHRCWLPTTPASSTR